MESGGSLRPDTTDNAQQSLLPNEQLGYWQPPASMAQDYGKRTLHGPSVAYLLSVTPN